MPAVVVMPVVAMAAAVAQSPGQEVLRQKALGGSELRRLMSRRRRVGHDSSGYFRFMVLILHAERGRGG